MKQQVIIIHGGDSFNTHEEYLNSLKNWEVSVESFKSRHDWKTNIEEVLGAGFDVLQPRMPNKSNARFEEWKIWFERMLPYMYDNVILIGHSLGAMFLAKYLAKNDFPKRIKQLHLVAPPHNKTADIGDFLIPESLKGVSNQSDKIYLYHSQDDPVVPFSELGVYEKALPGAEILVFDDRGHFNQPEFPELIKNVVY